MCYVSIYVVCVCVFLCFLGVLSYLHHVAFVLPCISRLRFVMLLCVHSFVLFNFVLRLLCSHSCVLRFLFLM